jgi:drug/metabolite transporter (DMT)-like permease
LISEPVLLALVAMACYGLADFIYKRVASAGIRADHFLVGPAWFYCPLIILYSYATGRLVQAPAAVWGSLAGLFSFAGLYFFARSLASGSVSTNASLFRLNFIVTVVLVVVFLGEPLTAAKVVGLAFALGATWLLLGGGDKKRKGVSRSIVQALIATVSFGASNFCHAIGLRHGVLPETMTSAQAAVFMPLATLVVFIADRKLPPPARAFVFGAPAAILILVATVSLLHGMAVGQASVLVPIAQMGFIVAALLGIVVLREPVTMRKAAGLAAALAALAILAAS